jgi:hypothetical protein
LVLLALGCRETPPEGAELTTAECRRIQQRIERLESADTGGLKDALHIQVRSGIEGCLGKGTQRAYRCVMQAESLGDLHECDSLFKD